MSRKLSFISDPCRLADVRAETRRFLAVNGFDEPSADLMVLALDEACANIIRHAYGNACRPVRLQMLSLKKCVRFVLRDYGCPCEPSKLRGRELEDIRPGGLGVHIIRQAFDRVDYSPQARGTRLTLEKSRPASVPGDLP